MKNYIELYRAKAQAKTNTIEDSILLCAYKALNAKSDGDKSDIFEQIIECLKLLRSFCDRSRRGL